MDSKWGYCDQQEPSVFIPYMFDTPNSYMVAVDSADFGSTLDLNTDSVQCYLENESNEEIDIETITPISHFDMDIKQTVEDYQQISADSMLRSDVKSVNDAKLPTKEADVYNGTVHSEQDLMDVDGNPASRELHEWQYVQYIDTYGSTQCFAVNNDTQEQKEQDEEIQTHHQLLPLQPDCSSSRLYRLLNLPSETSHLIDVEPKKQEPMLEAMYQTQSNSGENKTQSESPSVNLPSVEQIRVLADLTVLVNKINERDSSTVQPEAMLEDKRSACFPKLARFETEVAHHPVDDTFGTDQVEPASSPRATEELPFDAIGPSPANPEPALHPIAPNSEIGPFCTAIGIFSSVFYMTVLPHNRKKLQAEELKNGVIIELHNRWLQNRDTRKNFARVLCLLFDIRLDWMNPSVVMRLFRKALIPLLAERADLIRCFTTPATRRVSQSKWKVKKDIHRHQQIAQFDSAVFVIPPDGFEELTPNPMKTRSKVINSNLTDSKAGLNKGRKPTQGQQLLDLQTRFDAFRRAQRKHNTAFLRHISLIQRQLEDVKRNTSRRSFQDRRRSMPNPSI